MVLCSHRGRRLPETGRRRVTSPRLGRRSTTRQRAVILSVQSCAHFWWRPSCAIRSSRRPPFTATATTPVLRVLLVRVTAT
eukprot:1859999-Heterocapsa_arctica.AAC.1